MEQKEARKDLSVVRELINIFEKIYLDTIRCPGMVWNDGFEWFHYDYASRKGGHNNVSSTTVVNLGVINLEENEEEEPE